MSLRKGSNDYSQQNKQAFSALKYALTIFKNNGANEDMVEFLLKTFLDKSEEVKLLMPEIVWMVLKTVSPDHKFVKMVLPNGQAFNDYVLFKTDLEIIPKVGSAYKGYYNSKTRCQIWKDIAMHLIVREGALELILDEIKTINNGKFSLCKIYLIFYFLTKVYNL